MERTANRGVGFPPTVLPAGTPGRAAVQPIATSYASSRSMNGASVT
jgi:hypothetical protein